MAQDLIQWIQDATTLHRQVEITYLVTGYLVEITWDGLPLGAPFEGYTVEKALRAAMLGFDLSTNTHKAQLK